MKKLIFLILFLICPFFLYADTVYFKDGTSMEGTVTNENDKSVTLTASQGADKAKVCEFPREKIVRIEKKTPPQPVKVKESGLAKAKKEKRVKAVKPPKEAVAKKCKTKEVKPKPEKREKQALRKVNAQETALLKMEKKTSRKTVKPVKSARVTENTQESQLLKMEKEKRAKAVKPPKEAAAKKCKAKEVKPKAEKIDRETLGKAKVQETALLKMEKKTSRKAARPPQETPQPAEAIKKVTREEGKGLKYKLVKREEKRLIEPRKMDRMESVIVVPDATTNEELELIFSAVLEKELSASKNIDALWIITYAQGGYPYGLPKAYGIWSPPGGWYDFDNISDKSQYKWDYRFLKDSEIVR